MSNLAKNIRKYRQRKGWSQSDLARISGINAGHISHFETAKRKPNLANLIRLSDSLEVSTDDLIGLAGSKL